MRIILPCEELMISTKGGDLVSIGYLKRRLRVVVDQLAT